MNKQEALLKIKELKYYIEQMDNPKQKIKDAMLAHCLSYRQISRSDVIITDKLLTIVTPSANREWTFAVWDAVKTITEMYPDSYPRNNAAESGCDTKGRQCVTVSIESSVRGY